MVVSVKQPKCIVNVNLIKLYSRDITIYLINFTAIKKGSLWSQKKTLSSLRDLCFFFYKKWCCRKIVSWNLFNPPFSLENARNYSQEYTPVAFAMALICFDPLLWFCFMDSPFAVRTFVVIIIQSVSCRSGPFLRTKTKMSEVFQTIYIWIIVLLDR